MNDSLVFYGKLVGENKYIPLFKYFISTKISQVFCEYTLIPCNSEDKPIASITEGAKITWQDLLNIMEKLSKDNDEKEKELSICYKYKHMVQNISKILSEINELKTIIDDNNDVINFCSILHNILDSAESEDGIEELYLIIN